MAIRTATAEWKGDLQGGNGTFNGESGEIEGAYSFGSRFEEAGGTNPEELIGAAHASCFSMALAGDLEKAGHRPESVRTVARVSLRKGDAGYDITGIELDAQVQVAGIEETEFQQIAEGTRVGCPVSKALAAVPITLQASLAS
jgi:lipoyl-dependent peroxiredoxin